LHAVLLGVIGAGNDYSKRVLQRKPLLGSSLDIMMRSSQQSNKGFRDQRLAFASSMRRF
jgi:hypothetical protein